MRRLSLWMVLCLIGIALTSLSLFPHTPIQAQDTNPTDQQATVDALVAERLTATVIQQTNVPTTPTPFINPTTIPLPTLTLMPTAITVSSGARPVRESATVSRAVVYDINDDAFEAYQDGWIQHWSDDFEDADDIFEALVDDEPDFADAYIARGINQVLLNNDDDALASLASAAELTAQDGGTLTWVVSAAWAEGKIEEVINAGERMVALYPYDGFAVANLIRAYIVSNDAQTATDTATAFLALNPVADIIYELRRDTHNDLGEDALAEFDQLILDALEEERDGNYDDAIRLMEAALQLIADENLPAINQSFALWNMARFQLIDGDTDDAITALETSIDVNPDFAPAYFLLAIAFQFQFDFDNRLDILSEGIERVPDFPDNYIERALFYTNGFEPALAADDHWQYLQLSNARTLIWENYDPDDGRIHLPYYEGWRHHLPVELEDGDELTITAEDDTGTSDTSVDALIVLLDPQGNPIASFDDESFDNRDAEIRDFDIEADGIYTIVIGTGIGTNIGGILEIDVEID